MPPARPGPAPGRGEGAAPEGAAPEGAAPEGAMQNAKSARRAAHVMRLAVFSHCTIDSITVGGSTYERPGGPACYCGITARNLKFDVDLHTRFGGDFPRQYLEERGIDPRGALARAPTTRFSIRVSGARKELRLESRCDDIAYGGSDADGSLVSPVCGEISPDTFSRIKADSGFVLVDPQGFLRSAGPGGSVSLAGSDVQLSGVDAVKVNPDEGRSLAGCGGDEMARSLQRRGVEHVIQTDGAEVSMLAGDKVYSITLPNREIRDTTGVGDIFCAAFCCTMLRERDMLWALCFAGGAAQAALDSRQVGLLKIPRKGAVETNASYFYNLVKFRTV